jgi:hypothetical protein
MTLYLRSGTGVSPPECEPCGECSTCAVLIVAGGGYTEQGIGYIGATGSATFHSGASFGTTCDPSYVMMTVYGVSVTATFNQVGYNPCVVQRVCGAWDELERSSGVAPCDPVDLSALSLVVLGDTLTITATSLTMLASGVSGGASSFLYIAVDVYSPTIGKSVAIVKIEFADSGGFAFDHLQPTNGYRCTV